MCFKGKSIADVLDMTINRAVEFFENVPQILNKIKVLQEVGLGYIKLGQPSTTLSGGESQRVKLATELSKRDTGKTLYILDEPTTLGRADHRFAFRRYPCINECIKPLGRQGKYGHRY